MARATVPRRASKKQSLKEPFSFVLFLIGLFKLVKALLLIAIGIGALRFLHKDLSNSVLHWAQVLRVDTDYSMEDVGQLGARAVGILS